MKKLLTSAAFYTIIICSTLAAPSFVTPAMMKRNGLTDEQYELLWKQGKNPQIDVATARDWIFRSSRYANVVEWLEICGKTNNFAKLAHRLQGENFDLSETNATLKAEVNTLSLRTRGLEIDVAWWKDNYNAATNYASSLEVNLDVASNRVEAAESKAKRYEAFRAALVEKRDKAVLPSTKVIYQELIDKLDEMTGGK